MIRFKVEITYRDDTKEVFDCAEHPTITPDTLTLYHTHQERSYTPQQAIKSINVKDYWKR